jgi:hypothetical protein
MHKKSLLATTALLIAFTPTSAHAVKVLYSSKFPIPGEINGSFGMGSMRTALAAGMMGAKGFGNNSIPNPAQTELSLLTLCKQHSGVTTWPEQCNPGGVAVALSKTFKQAAPNNNLYQNWVVTKEVDQTKAINLLIAGLRDWKTPAVIPMYGVPDHWGVVEQMYVDVVNNTNTLLWAKFRDGGSIFAEPLGVEGDDGIVGADATYNGYDDVPLTKNGTFFKTLYYKMFLDPNNLEPNVWYDIIAQNDPYRGFHIMLREPPVSALTQEPNLKDLVLYEGTPLVGEDEWLTPSLARDLVFDALDIEGLLAEPEYATIAARGVPGDGWAVRGTMPAGDVQTYFVVPIHDGEEGGLLGLVTLAEDGRFQMARPMARPVPVAYQTPASARALALAALGRGEALSGGGLRWGPTCAQRNCNAPDLPYYEFSAAAEGGRSARVMVPLVGGTRAVRH